MSLTLAYALLIRTLAVELFLTLIARNTVDALHAMVVPVVLKIHMAMAHTVQEPSVEGNMVWQRRLPSMQ